MNFKTNFLKSLWATMFLFGLLQLNAQSFFNTFDRARPLDQGAFVTTVSFAKQYFSYDGETEDISNTYGLVSGFGVTDEFSINLGWASYDLLNSYFKNFKVKYYIVKPKYSMLEGKIALGMPFGVVISKFKESDESETETYIAPEFMFNYPVNDIFEFGANARIIIPFVEDANTLIRIDVAFGLSHDLSLWAIRPEFGILFDPGEEGMYFTPGVAVSYYFNTRYY